MAKIKLNSVDVSFPVYEGKVKKPSIASSLFKIGYKKVYFDALSDVDLELVDGDKVGLIGGNGSGKTTLLKVLAGMLPSSSGKVDICGTVMPLLHKDSSTMPDATCLQNVILNGLKHGITGKDLDDYVESTRRIADIDRFFNSPVGALSSGMKNKLILSMLVNSNKDIVVMDEWVGTSDGAVLDKGEGLLSRLTKSAKIFVLASHREGILEAHCNKILRLEQGRIVDIIKTP